MAYRLRDGLTYCEVDGQFVFLDIERDRYFQLPCTLTRAFNACRHGIPGTDISVLSALGIVIEVSAALDSMQPCIAAAACCSVLESASAGRRSNPKVIAEVLALLFTTQFKLRTQRLKSVLRASASAYGLKKSLLDASSSVNEPRYLQAVQEYQRARRLIPIEPHCLLDSLALRGFLSRRRLPATLVFGIIPAPFSAHCWLQVGNLALNDSVGNVNAHTPIRIV